MAFNNAVILCIPQNNYTFGITQKIFTYLVWKECNCRAAIALLRRLFFII